MCVCVCVCLCVCYCVQLDEYVHHMEEQRAGSHRHLKRMCVCLCVHYCVQLDEYEHRMVEQAREAQVAAQGERAAADRWAAHSF